MKAKLKPECPDCGETDPGKFGLDNGSVNKKQTYCLICKRLRSRESWAKRQEVQQVWYVAFCKWLGEANAGKYKPLEMSMELYQASCAFAETLCRGPQEEKEDLSEGPTGCMDDGGDELSLALRQLGRDGLNKVLSRGIDLID